MTFDPNDCAFCVAPATRRLSNGADAGCPLHGEAIDKAKPGAASAAPGFKNTPSITVDPPMFVVVRFCADGDSRRGPEVEYVRPTDTIVRAREQLEHLRETATAGGRHCCRYELFELRGTL